jgi:hypothetical protein
VRITPISWLIVLAGAVAFGGGIVGLARVLPSDDVARGRASYGTAPLVLAPTEPHGEAKASPPIGAPPASSPLDAPSEPISALDFHPLDPTRRDRYGNAPKRDATPDELLRIAAAHDLVVDDLRWQPDGAALDVSQIAAMKAANPRLRVLRYVGALTNNDGPIFDIAPDDGVHGPWFLRDGSGDFVRAYEETAPWDGRPSFAFDAASIDVRNDIGAWARQFVTLGYDGIVLDGISACVPAPGSTCAAASVLSLPTSKTTNRPYGDAEWLAATIGLLQAIRHAAPRTHLFLLADGDQSPLLSFVDGLVILSQ